MALDLGTMDLRDALDLAILMEEEARQRYLAFSQIVGGRYQGDASDVFRLMASYEQKHGEQLEARRRSLFHDQPRRMQLEMLDDVEAPDRGQPRVFMSARDAMQVAIAAEEKAYDFFDGAVRAVRDPGVKSLFEELRAEEAEHRRILSERILKMPVGPDMVESDADQPGSDPG
jgi:erythrin-vacuolar iron transport family protein